MPLLTAQPEGSVEIPTFGLLPELVGQGYGGHALTLAVLRAWNTVDRDDLAPARHVWLHTSALDHPHALGNYLARGFRSVLGVAQRAQAPMSLSGPAGLDDDYTS